MKLSDARKLHNGDQVVVKDSGEVVTVHQAYPLPGDPKTHCVQAHTRDGWVTLTHRDIE